VAIHSAKDLPYPLPRGIEVIALFEAFDQRDSLVSRNNLRLKSLPAGARIGTSSPTRKRELLTLRPDMEVVSIRGTIEERIAQVDSGFVDALIVASCALSRLGLSHRAAEILPFETHPLQGNLAVTARNDREDLKLIFADKDIRRLYGKVTLVGFGPGNPDLLTLGGDKALTEADIIFHDDLIEQSFPDKYNADKVYVGKRKDRHSFEQGDINRLMLNAAREGKQVVRLKGGDPMVFAHGGEEIEFLQSNFVDVTVIPGVSSGIAVSSLTKVPLTHRGIASSVAFVTGHSPETSLPNADTVVIYMGGSYIRNIAFKAIADGRNPETPVLLVHNVSHPDQQEFFSTLAELSVSDTKYPTPVIIVIGDVVSLRNNAEQAVVKPNYLITGTQKEHYEQIGNVIHQPLISIDPIWPNEALVTEINKLNQYDWLFFTSRYTVNFFFEALEKSDKDARVFAGLKIASVGRVTSAALKMHGIIPDVQAVEESSAGLLNHFRENNTPVGKLLIPRSDIGLPVLPEGMRNLGWDVTTVSVYHNTYPENLIQLDLDNIPNIVFSSPSCVSNFLKLYKHFPPEKNYIFRGKETEKRFTRFRNLRTDIATREKFADIRLSYADFIYPYFIVDGENQEQPVHSLKGISRFSIDRLLIDLEDTVSLGIDKILLFGVIDNNLKDEKGSAGYDPDSLVCRAIRTIKAKFPQLIVITDVCLCAYTAHGHCGLLQGETIDNDSTLPLLAQMAWVHAQAGADFVAPSAMMDGQIQALKQKLTENRSETKILAYSAKYSSNFYGPFRDAAGSAPGFGDRKTYQMDYRTLNQGVDEIAADISEGADWVMVKPAQAYLDIIHRGKTAFPDVPMVAYQVSGEYALLKNGAEAGLINEAQGFLESLTAIKRAGANYIITYYAKDFIRKGL
jgi:uroporphyrinogen III methyltransferase/synthase